MLSSDIISTFQWWLTIFIIGLGFLPLTTSIFKNFFDKGYAFSKAIGLSITTYAIFILGVLHIARFTQISAFIIFFSLVIVIFILNPNKKSLFSLLKEQTSIFLFEEIFFLAALLFWAYIHSFNPDIHGLEKFMDFGFLNSILRSDYFPPRDMWFTPLSINYYYFGHMATGVLTKLSSIPSNITFNLMLSTIFALCLTQAYSIGMNLYNLSGLKTKFKSIKLFLSGLLSAFLVTFTGNLHIIYGFFKPYTGENPPPFWTLPFMPFSFPNSYWYPNATRFIYHTIHEFPIYSWVVADLHGHVLDIPFVLLTIAYLLSLFIGRKEKANHKLSSINHLLTGFLLAVMYMTNAWDGGIYLLFAGFVLFYIYRNNFKNFIVSFVSITFGLFLFSSPYNIFFKPFASGIGVLCAPGFLVKIGKIGPLLFESNHCQHSFWWELLVLYGFFYFFVISFGVFISRGKKMLQTDIFVFLLIILATFLIILPEFIYLKDIYPAHYRANTMFKLVFQAFIILSICTSYIITRLFSSFDFKKIKFFKKLLVAVYILVVLGMLSLVSVYPYFAINSYYGLDQKDPSGKPKKPVGLDGTKYLKSLYPGDYDAINWLNKNIKGQPVILEGQGDSYTDYARISANTGLPTVLGWTVHEWLWRGTYDVPAPRITDVQTIYETKNIEIAKQLLKKYDISYVVIGILENQKYQKLSAEKFNNLGKVIYQNDYTKIYNINP